MRRFAFKPRKPAWAIIACAVATPALAAHFNFQVPYEFHKMGPDVSHITIQCVVFDDASQSVGSGYKIVSINRNTGEAVGTADVPVDADVDKSAYDARTYRCRITLMGVAGANPPQQYPSETNPNWQFQPDTSAPFVQEATGALPTGVPRKVEPVKLLPMFRR